MSNVGKTQVKGHGLWNEGAPEWNSDGAFVGYRPVASPLRAKCRCGALSPAGVTRHAAQKWHRQHKADVLAAGADQ